MLNLFSPFRAHRKNSKFCVQSSKFKVLRSEFKVLRSEFKVLRSEFKVQSSEFLVLNRVSSTANPNYMAPCLMALPYLNSASVYLDRRRRYARRRL